MIITKDNERLYLSNWQYNACRIISTLATVVENNGGSVKPQRHTAMISNRTLSAAILDLENKLQEFNIIQKEKPTDRREEHIKEMCAKLEKYKSINNDPIPITHTTYISFTFDNNYYSYSVDDNPFFDFYYSKTSIINGKHQTNVYSDTDKKEWLYDCFFSFSATDADVKEAANMIFNMLATAKNSAVYRDSTKKRVPNTYDGGYHYETIYSPDRYEKIDF